MRSSLISFLLLGLPINFIFLKTLPIFANTYPQEYITSNQIAEKYCDFLGKNLFTVLYKESTLTYDYYFWAITKNSIQERNKFLKKI